MSEEQPQRTKEEPFPGVGHAPGLGLAIALAALAAAGAGLVLLQLLEKRLSKPERARLRFYKYLRERGHLES
jgi:hypothetical protein